MVVEKIGVSAGKVIAGLYPDYERLARLRYPIGYWNELALVCAAAVPVALWLVRTRRVAGVLLLYGVVVALLLTYLARNVGPHCSSALQE